MVGCKQNIGVETLQRPNIETPENNLNQNKGIKINLPEKIEADDSRYNWEDSITSVVVIAYNSFDTDQNKLPRIVYRFNETDMRSRTTVIPTTDKDVSEETLDFYALINSREEIATNTKVEMSFSELMQLNDYDAKTRYNSESYQYRKENIMGMGGFLMSGVDLNVAPNQNEPVDVNLNCKRMVAKIDVQLQTDNKSFTADATLRGDAHATIFMQHAIITRNNRTVNIFDPETKLTDNYQGPFVAQDTIMQYNGADTYWYPENGRWTFYVMPTLERGTITYPFIDQNNNNATKLEIFFYYYPDKNEKVYHTYRFIVPIQGGNNRYWAMALNQNTTYTLNLKVVGIGGAYDENDIMIPYNTTTLSDAPIISKSYDPANPNTFTIELGGSQQ